MGKILGLILLGGGIYFAWEAHSILTWGLFQLSAMVEPTHRLTSLDLQLLNSFAVDLLVKLGVQTVGELQRYLSVMRVGGIVVTASGWLLTFH